ncbi:hypothetical protein FRC03_002157 [Tulasnella sp. 419]|nr:hypothetical protein FRC03_002157 [Tulasnella sp. 419]
MQGSSSPDIDDVQNDLDYIADDGTLPGTDTHRYASASRTTHAATSNIILRSLPMDKGRLKERHIAMVALAGMLGTGLFLTSGAALADAGPLGSLTGYVLMGIVTTCVAYTAAEMSALCPATGGFIVHTQKFVNPALGAATGWNFAYALATVQAVEIVAATLLASFWTSSIPPVACQSADN